MKRPTLSLAALAWIVAMAAGTRAGANVTYSSFPSASGLTLVGNASIASNRLRLTRNSASQTSAAWFSTQQNVGAGFSTTFTFSISGQTSGGGDGFAFVIQNSSVTAIGGDGCRLGYDGIADSVAIEFDTYQSDSCAAGNVNDPSDNHISVHTRGTGPNSAMESASIGWSSSIPDLSAGSSHTVRIDYAPGGMEIYIDDLTTPAVSAPIDLAGSLSLNAGRAWVGLTASTGGATETHDIRTWTLTEGPPPGNGRPRTPIITEPQFDGRIINPQDVHMETAAFYDSGGWSHLCTDWEIHLVSTDEVVWRALCVPGIERLHIHLGDGEFVGTHAGRHDLIPDLDYVLRARHRDNSGIAATEWSLWGRRLFHTATLTSNIPLLIEDVRGSVEWRTDAGDAVALPGGGAPAALVLETAVGGLFLSITGSGGGGNLVVNPASLGSHQEARVRIEGGGSGLTLPGSSLVFLDEDCTRREIFLPALSLGPGERALFWPSTSGSTYVALAAQEHADLTTLARGSESPYLAAQTGYVVERFAGGFQLPVNVAFVPSPGPDPTDVYFYVTELYGQIKVVTRNGTVSTYASGLLNFPSTGDFPGSGEQGLAGVVVDPQGGDLFATVLADNGAGSHIPRVIRLHSDDGGRTASTITTVISMPNDPQGQSHQISNVSFGPDGMLYVHMGDGFVASAGQDLTLFRGKILRMTRSGGAPPDNPLYDAADGITARDYVYEYGVRNPFGGAWRLSDGAHYIVENGPSVDRLHRLVAGRNAGYDGSDASMSLFAMYTWSPAHAPVNITFTQAGVFGGSGFPPEKMDHAFVSESGPTYGDGPQLLGKRIVEFVIASDGTLQSGPATLVEYAGSGHGSVVGLTAGPDGLYFTTLYQDLNAATPVDAGAWVYRVRHVPPVTCCRVDVDGDGAVLPADLAAFVSLWVLSVQGGTTAGDFDGNGQVEPADVAAFVGSWLAAVTGGGC